MAARAGGRLFTLLRPRAATQVIPPVARSMGAKAGPGGAVHFHVSPWHQHTGTALATLMWLWVFYRAKEDGAVVLGLIHPWDAHHHHDGSDAYKFELGEVGEVPKLTAEEEEEDDE
mmetsp:Transcript_22032/g.49852  ORF Transcript_22032/g.49852 Transcript_22032/m.49852 type:complete len:116 (+) Transcript_22032:15-362(+)|eukprot:CAMPEP_0172584246 /NCGR_PEP_ID=MMETSP1068-20121228/3835_1 /TAXON_ID=35684 /ORGANISM="Pseudopedinella elastica, Strain CCMP716" /LENGTH=115 /DNA_ID=CAMNT_0013378359 /DNA_START=15 /DNA_END=362 /DNA_ORIENTATION=+